MTDIVVFDWETTSAEPRTARGVQFAALHSKEGEWWSGLTDPEVDISEEASAIHGISAEQLKDAPKDFVVAATFVEELHKHAASLLTAGHNSTTFDIPITNRLAAMTGTDLRIPGLHIDTMLLAARLWPEAPSMRLSATEEEANKPGEIGLTQYLRLGTGEGAHDALADCHMVLKLIEAAQEKSGKTPQELAEWLQVPYVHDTCHFGKHKGKRWGKEKGEVPWFYVKWLTENWTSASIDLQATVKHHYGLRFRFKGAL